MWNRLERYFEAHTGSWRRLKRYLSIEILIEYRACLYFCCILFFYCCYLGVHGDFFARVPVLVEMILLTYAMCYLQLYVFQNFDETDQLGRRGLAGILVCSVCYTAASWIFLWFDRKKTVTALFFIYMVMVYVSARLANKLKRRIDTELLNQLLDKYKSEQKKGGQEPEKRAVS